MKMIKMITGLAMTGILLSGASLLPAYAHSDSHGDGCEVSLNYDVAVEPSKLVISQGEAEKYRVESGNLYVEGEQVRLNASQQQLLQQYSDEVSSQVPDVIALVNDAVATASQAVSMALTPILGDASGAKLDELIAGITERIERVAYRQGDKFYLGATESSLENAFNEEFEQEVEQLVQNSIGSIMMALGSEMMSADGDSFEEKMEAFGSKMENLGDDIERQMELQASELEARAERMCERFERLIVLEHRLRNEIPELNAYPLADTGKILE